MINFLNDLLQVDTTILGLDDKRAKEMPYIASMGIYVISKDVMLNLLREQFPGANDFGSEVIPGATSVGMRVWPFFFSAHVYLPLETTCGCTKWMFAFLGVVCFFHLVIFRCIIAFLFL